jgi:hypothetical protein
MPATPRHGEGAKRNLETSRWAGGGGEPPGWGPGDRLKGLLRAGAVQILPTARQPISGARRSQVGVHKRGRRSAPMVGVFGWTTALLALWRDGGRGAIRGVGPGEMACLRRHGRQVVDRFVAQLSGPRGRRGGKAGSDAPGRGPWAIPGRQELQVGEDSVDDLLILDDGNDLHGRAAARAEEGVNFISRSSHGDRGCGHRSRQGTPRDRTRGSWPGGGDGSPPRIEDLPRRGVADDAI